MTKILLSVKDKSGFNTCQLDFVYSPTVITNSDNDNDSMIAISHEDCVQ